MLELKDDNGKKLPKKINDKVNAFIDNLSKVRWLNPSPYLKREDVDKQINIVLECFWLEAGIEYRKLESKQDWGSAKRDVMDSVFNELYHSSRESVLCLINNSIYSNNMLCIKYYLWSRSSIRSLTWIDSSISIRDFLNNLLEVLIEDNKDFKEKYPNGAFKQLFRLWEMWLYPVWVLKETWKFTVYVPKIYKDFINKN